MSVDSYLGIDREYNSEYKQSGSKFYGFLFPVYNNKSFENEIKKLKATYPDATHVCNACVLGIDRQFQKLSDDGEPSNSAGRPILYALLSKNVTNIGCAVVRYYGGKKLGIPGLIEAYGKTAEASLDIAKFKNLILKDSIVCKISVASAYLLYNFLAKQDNVNYTVENELFMIQCPKSMTSVLLTELKKINTLVVIDED